MGAFEWNGGFIFGQESWGFIHNKNEIQATKIWVLDGWLLWMVTGATFRQMLWFPWQEWRSSLDAYVRHFTSSLELEYEAERQAVLEKVQKRSTRQLQVGSRFENRTKGRVICFGFDMGEVRDLFVVYPLVN